MSANYTDIDYVVFTDAARFVTLGSSPYERATYRYTPLLSIVLTPNIFLFKGFGKCLFAAADIVVGYLIHRILVLRGMPSQKALWLDALWLLNPMVANISTRGNAESLLAVMVLGSFYLIMIRQFYAGCCVFGLSVHFKIYPIIYTLPLLFLLDERYGDPVEWPQIIWPYQHMRLALLHLLKESERVRNMVQATLYQCVSFLSPIRILFGLISGGFFLIVTWMMYQGYGDEFLQHTYLYHITRKDHRHNFSVWFYQMYLAFDAPIAGKLLGVATFVPQMALVATVGVAFGKDLFFACFLQTFVFVTFNKVCTSQYFMWYISLFPLILPSTGLSFRWKGLSLVLAWVASQGLWLQFAYQLEFLGQNTFFSLWLSSLLFFIVNCWIIVEFVLHHQFEYVYSKSGRIRWAWGMGDSGSTSS
ncbi:PIG-M-domain-containing protein [Spinellus fusiger]|nr:PIG-M-domain-containing protein [Spinellus fusiger]